VKGRLKYHKCEVYLKSSKLQSPTIAIGGSGLKPLMAEQTPNQVKLMVKAKKSCKLSRTTVNKVVHGARFTFKVAHLHITHSLKNILPNITVTY
jgi:hypothetical protein